MEFFTVSLFGHREIDDLRQLDCKILPLIRELIQTKSYVSFLIGRNGEFDEYTASVIKRVQKSTGKENNELVLVLPYYVANLEYYEKYYDSVTIPERVCGVHYKVALTERNRWMVEQSDLVMVYLERDNGGAYKAMKYAESLGKRIIKI